MKNSNILKTILIISGIIGIGIGGSILFMPAAFYASNGIALHADINLLSEIRAPGGALLVCGIAIVAGAFIDKLAFTATIVSILMYSSYGGSRILSMTLDGIPTPGLVAAAVVEITLGLTCFFAFVKYRQHEATTIN